METIFTLNQLAAIPGASVHISSFKNEWSVVFILATPGEKIELCEIHACFSIAVTLLHQRVQRLASQLDNLLEVEKCGP